MLRQHCGQHTPTILGFSSVISIFVIQLRVGSILVPIHSAMVTLAALPPSSPPSPALLRLLIPSSHVWTCGATASRIGRVLPFSRWPSYVSLNAIPVRLGPLAINLFPVITSPSSSSSSAPPPCHSVMANASTHVLQCLRC